MALKTMPYRRVELLIRDYVSAKEDDRTTALIKQLAPARSRGYLRRSELEAVCKWKSPRAIRLVRSNSNRAIRSHTRTALGTRSERRRLEQLTGLAGVSVPMASAILMLLYPRRYGVIDIRVWQMLHQFGTVTKNEAGKGFGFKNWFQFLMILRHYSRKLGVTVRDVERALFVAHKEYQRGVLY